MSYIHERAWLRNKKSFYISLHVYVLSVIDHLLLLFLQEKSIAAETKGTNIWFISMQAWKCTPSKMKISSLPLFCSLLLQLIIHQKGR